MKSFLIIIILAAGVCQGQDISLGARCGGLAGISSITEDLWAWANNPAALACINSLATGMSVEQRFLMKETGVYAAGVVIPVKGGSLGAGTIFSGYPSFYTQDARFGFGRSFAGKLLAGVSLIYRVQKTGDGAPPIHMATFSLGTLITFSDKLSLGIGAFNPFRLYFRNRPYGSFPCILAVGIAYRHSNMMLFAAEVRKDFDLPLQVRFGCEIGFRDHAFLRGGFRLMPFEYAFGAGYRKKRLSVEVSSLSHEYLGLSPRISFQYTVE